MSIENEPKKDLENVNLRIEEPSSGGIFFAFDSKTKEASYAYNSAINKVLTEAGLSPTPHGESRDIPNAGYQNWETWTINRSQADELLPKIEEEAQKIFSERM
jgi:hypothetical protein